MKTWVRKSLKVGILSAGFLLIGGAAANAASTTDNFGVLGGNQVQVPIQAPISVSGNAIGLLGTASASHSGGGAMAVGNASAAGSTSNNSGIASGNQVTPLVQVPIDVCGNAVSLFGTAAAACGSAAGTGTGGTGGYGTGTGGTGTGGTGTGTGGDRTGTG